MSENEEKAERPHEGLGAASEAGCGAMSEAFDPLTAPIEDVDAALKARGWDPEAVAQRGREFVSRLLGHTMGGREEERVRLEERERVIRAVNAWARERWDAEVAARPRQNVYYNVLDTTWMQVRQLSMDDLEPHLEGNGGDDA